MIPRQEYELLEVSKLGIESGTALTCDDCGRVIFNFAVIKGKQDGKSYTVGLTCVKKLLKIKQVSFDFETQMRYERECYLFDEAARFCKKLDKLVKGGVYTFGLEDFKDKEGNEFVSVYRERNGRFDGRMGTFEARFKPFFQSIKTA